MNNCYRDFISPNEFLLPFYPYKNENYFTHEQPDFEYEINDIDKNSNNQEENRTIPCRYY